MTDSVQNCAPERYSIIQALIDETINEDIVYQKQPLDLRNQRTFAVKVGGLGDLQRWLGLTFIVGSEWFARRRQTDVQGGQRRCNPARYRCRW